MIKKGHWEIIAQRIAEQILVVLKGGGFWKLHKSETPTLENYLDGLNVGDVVYCFDEYKQQLHRKVVCFVENGVGYYADSVNSSLPKLFVVDDFWGRSEAEAFSKQMREVVKSIELYDEWTIRIEKLKQSVNDAGLSISSET